MINPKQLIDQGAGAIEEPFEAGGFSGETDPFLDGNPPAAPPQPAAGKHGGQAEREAMRIVREEEEQRGRRLEKLNKKQEGIEGCDFLSYPPDQGPPDPVEVKGSGAPFRKKLKNGDEAFSYGSEVNAEQLERARKDPRWRLEVVANLAAVLAGTGTPERLTLTGEEVVARAKPWKFRIPLDGLEDRIKR